MTSSCTSHLHYCHGFFLLCSRPTPPTDLALVVFYVVVCAVVRSAVCGATICTANMLFIVLDDCCIVFCAGWFVYLWWSYVLLYYIVHNSYWCWLIVVWFCCLQCCLCFWYASSMDTVWYELSSTVVHAPFVVLLMLCGCDAALLSMPSRKGDATELREFLWSMVTSV